MEDFLDFGSTETIKKALLRLEEGQKISRLSHGTYFKPKFSSVACQLTPSTEDVAKAIARRDKARIVPSHLYAANILGLITQVSVKSVFLTDGATRVVKIDNRTINFKKATPKSLSTTGKIFTLVIQSFKQIKKDNMDDTALQIITNHLHHEDKEMIIHDSKLAPAWIREIL